MAEAPAETRSRLVVPAYFHPVLHPDHWGWLADHAPQVRLVILNVANGPGREPEPVFHPVLDRLGGAGVPVAGYVDTNYGHRPPEDVLAELGRYLNWYGVKGVCFDRVAAEAGQLRYYAALSARARDMGAGVVLFNHGVHPVEEYAEHADLLGTFEGPWPAYLRMAVPSWTRSHPAEMFHHVVYSVPTGHFGDAFMLAARRRAGAIYITDRDGANPYDQLPGGGKALTPWIHR
jgi:hypothetical protein